MIFSADRLFKSIVFLSLLVLSHIGYSAHIKTSVLIPCIFSHIQYLPNLLEDLEHQTVLPDEVIISASSLTATNIEDLDRIENKQYAFDLKIIKDKKRKSAGANRNSAFLKSSGELIIFQDADDIPHPQRIEISKFLYKKLHFDFLFHLSFSKDFNESKSIENIKNLMKGLVCSPHRLKLEKIKRRNMAMVAEINSKQSRSKREIGLPDNTPRLLFTFGNIAVKRKVLERYRYNNAAYGEDSGLFFQAGRRFKRNYLVYFPLNLYAYVRTSEPVR